ncbi:MAG TPA: recombinase family protein [Kiritimatiellia bacterium]|nr:recombinase family protein [Kiritimatiellia bacterium]
MSKAVIYCRVSSTEQVDNTSLSTQERDCREWCSRNGFEVFEVFVERGESAKTADRPEFLRMIDTCTNKKNLITRLVVYRTDRFARSMYDYAVYRAKLRKSGVQIISVSEPVSDDAAGALMENIFASYAEFDNSVRAARAKTAMKAIKAAGGWCHKAPYGFKIVRRADGIPMLEEDEITGSLVRRAFEMVIKGEKPKDAYDLLMPDLCRTSFYGLFRDPIYATLDSLLFNGVQKALGNVRPANKRLDLFPLKGVLVCGTCKRPMTASRSKGRRKHYDYYHCDVTGHKSRVRPEDILPDIEALLVEVSDAMLEHMPFFRRFVDNQAHRDSAQALADKGRLTAEITDLERQKDKLVDALLSDRISNDIFDRKSRSLDSQLAAARNQLSDADSTIRMNDRQLELAEERMKNIATIWAKCEPKDRPRMILSLFPNGITISKGKVRTVASDSIFGELCVKNSQYFSMAPPTGFEPVLPG